MTTNEDIRNIQINVREAFTKSPENALNTSKSYAEVTNALVCTYSEGSRKTIMDMPTIAGGNDEGPTPGFHARAAISGCVAIGIKQEAIFRQIKCESIKVELEMDFDDSAMFGIGENTAAPLNTRLLIKIVSEEGQEKLQNLVDRVLETDPYFLALRDSQSVSAELKVLKIMD